jgi:hypothetical protein
MVEARDWWMAEQIVTAVDSAPQAVQVLALVGRAHLDGIECILAMSDKARAAAFLEMEGRCLSALAVKPRLDDASEETVRRAGIVRALFAVMLPFSDRPAIRDLLPFVEPAEVSELFLDMTRCQMECSETDKVANDYLDHVYDAFQKDDSSGSAAICADGDEARFATAHEKRLGAHVQTWVPGFRPVNTHRFGKEL